MIVDTHIHVWNLDKAEYPWIDRDNSILNRTWNIEELENERKKAGVTKGVLVQSSGNFEDTDWMLEVAEQTDWIAGVVVWLPLTDPFATQKALEEKFLKEKYFKGVRHQIHDERDTKWLLQEIFTIAGSRRSAIHSKRPLMSIIIITHVRKANRITQLVLQIFFWEILIKRDDTISCGSTADPGMVNNQ